MLAEQQIPVHSVAAGRRKHVVLYSVEKVMKRYCQDRAGLLTKCTNIDHYIAKQLLDHGYKQLSHMRLWCPVQVCVKEFENQHVAKCKKKLFQ